MNISERYPSTNMIEMVFNLIQKLDKQSSEHHGGCGTYDPDTAHEMRVSLATAYNEIIKTNHYTFYTPIHEFSFKIEPKGSVSLSDTISCPFTKDHTQSCGCFGRGYITIRMLSEQGIKSYIEKESDQIDYIKLQNGEELPMVIPTVNSRSIKN